MCGIVISPRDDHYRPTNAMWARDLCTFTGCLTAKNRKATSSLILRPLPLHKKGSLGSRLSDKVNNDMTQIPRVLFSRLKHTDSNVF